MSAALPLWTAAEAAAATEGRTSGDWKARGVSIDTRSLVADDLFVALSGPSFDGHNFVGQALEKGAAGAVVTHVTEGVEEERLLFVPDTFEALRALGSAARTRSAARVIAVTGSVGKTGVKEALALALSRQGTTHATRGNLNNHFGLPLTLARMPAATDFAVLEMGMSAAGEIEPLTRLARPDVALITTVAAAHLEFFDSVESIADAKAEIFLGLAEGGTAILPRDNAHYPRLLDHARRAGASKIVTFGRHPGAECRLIEALPTETGMRVTADIHGRDIRMELFLHGEHHAVNACAVLAAVHAIGADVEAAAEALGGLEPMAGRGLVRQVTLKDGTLRVIDESYNASPSSMAAALRALGQAPVGKDGRRIAALGDMLELGAASGELHEGLAAAIEEAGIDLVFSCGQGMAKLMNVLPSRMLGGWTKDSETLAPQVREAVRPGDTVLVKGSLGSAMANVIDALTRPEPNGGSGRADAAA